MNLAGKLLIAMSGLQDPRFASSVIMICAHSHEGAMGLMINKTLPDLSFHTLLTQMNIPVGPRSREIKLYSGGPVDRARGFVLHSSDYQSEGMTLSIEGGFGMTASMEVLELLACGRGPASAIMALGYAGWDQGQLESEIARNDWLIVDATSEIIFDTHDDAKWVCALRKLGIDPLLLSPTAGHA
jgi:putative transcriptional regulator